PRLDHFSCFPFLVTCPSPVCCGTFGGSGFFVSGFSCLPTSFPSRQMFTCSPDHLSYYALLTAYETESPHPDTGCHSADGPSAWASCQMDVRRLPTAEGLLARPLGAGLRPGGAVTRASRTVETVARMLSAGAYPRSAHHRFPIGSP